MLLKNHYPKKRKKKQASPRKSSKIRLIFQTHNPINPRFKFNQEPSSIPNQFNIRG